MGEERTGSWLGERVRETRERVQHLVDTAAAHAGRPAHALQQADAKVDEQVHRMVQSMHAVRTNIPPVVAVGALAFSTGVWSALFFRSGMLRAAQNAAAMALVSTLVLYPDAAANHIEDFPKP
ncbi:hypothetical protein FVE85_4358 [Porphyridium purpureum]|uniref:Uncharacterized protein n=1 Tax=Porphyridium purpureum TaxID=35688 RepID=A0A5J4YJS2_PORPP|nr:hypothetical protein FVE85_4358 [Porphyridium purpureum]|eukprot:POR2387..scf270_19